MSLKRHVAYQLHRREVLKKRMGRVRELARKIEAATGIPSALILGRNRYGEVSEARQLLMVELWRDGNTIQQVAELISRDHTTVMYGIRRVLGDAAYEREVRERWEGPRGCYRGKWSASDGA